MSFFDDKKVLEQKTVTNTNTDTTSGSQVLQQEFGPADGSRIAEEQKLGERTISLSTKAQQQVTQLPYLL